MDPLHIAGIIAIVAFVGILAVVAPRFIRGTRLKGDKMGIKDLEFFSEEKVAFRKARRREVIEDTRQALGNLDDDEKARILAEMVEARDAWAALIAKAEGGNVDVFAAIHVASETRDVFREFRKGIAG